MTLHRPVFIVQLSLLMSLFTPWVQAQEASSDEFGLNPAAKLSQAISSMTGEPDDDAPEYAAEIHTILDLSGFLSLSDQVKYSAQRVLSQTQTKSNEQPSATFNTAQQYAVAKTLSPHWAPSPWQSTLLEAVSQLTLQQRQQTLSLLNDPAVIHARELEKATIAIQQQPEYLAYVRRLQSTPPVLARTQLIAKLDQASGFSELVILARQQAYAAIHSAVPNWLPPQGWQQGVKQEVLYFLFYAYRTTPNGDLKTYAAKFENKHFQTLLTLVQAASQRE